MSVGHARLEWIVALYPWTGGMYSALDGGTKSCRICDTNLAALLACRNAISGSSGEADKLPLKRSYRSDALWLRNGRSRRNAGVLTARQPGPAIIHGAIHNSVAYATRFLKTRTEPEHVGFSTAQNPSVKNPGAEILRQISVRAPRHSSRQPGTNSTF
jgi:hypothetical protein